MADQLCTPADLASALQSDLDTATATLWIEIGTAIVQAAADGQRIIEVVDDEIEILGLTDSWLNLPQIPVTDVASVILDGVALEAVAPGGDRAGYRRHGNRLWRTDGWQTYYGEPSLALVVNTHGHPAGHQKLQLGRGAVLSIAKTAYDNPAGVASEKIDDYAVVYAEMQDAMDASPSLQKALKKQYGRGGGLIRIS